MAENHIFKGKIKDYEQLLVDFIIDSGKAKSVDPNLQLILGYLGIHKRLTQKQLKDLTKLSTGTISKKLGDLLNLGVIRKEKIPKTNKSLYVNAPEAYGDIADTTWEEFTKISEFLKEKLKEIEKYKDKAGSILLSERIKGLLETFETVKNIWSDIEFIFKQDNKRV